MQVTIAGVDLRTLCVLLLLAMVPALLLPGLVAYGMPSSVVGSLLLMQAGALPL